MDYKALYKSKLCTAEDAVLTIKSGMTIATSQCCNEPNAIFDAFKLLKGKEHDISMYAPMTFAKHEFLIDPSYKDTFNIDCTFLTGDSRKARTEGYINYYPCDLHSGPKRWMDDRDIDVFIGAVSPMDSHGYFTMPLCLIHEIAFMERAKKVILEVNPNLPRVYGDTEIHISQVDMIVEAETPIPILPKSNPNELEKTIGQYCASLVRDGCTLQLGIGGIPDAAALSLFDKHDLGIHSEMITNSMVDLVEAGVINGRKKTLHPGKIIGTFAYGTQELYDMMNENPSVRLLRGDYVNDPRVVAQNNNFISINSCIAVDLTGQVCSESIGPVQFSGSGGQTDMAVGAAHSAGGLNVIAMKSTKKHGTVSSINAILPAGSIVTLGRNNLDFVVTEYGIARMVGRSVKQRVENLIAIAHPDFRAELREQANKLNLF